MINSLLLNKSLTFKQCMMSNARVELSTLNRCTVNRMSHEKAEGTCLIEKVYRIYIFAVCSTSYTLDEHFLNFVLITAEP